MEGGAGEVSGRRPHVRVWATVGFAISFIAAHLRTYLLFIGAVQATVVLVVIPQLRRILDAVLASTGLNALTEQDVVQVATDVPALLYIGLIGVIASVVVFVEMVVLLVMAHRHQSGLDVSVRSVLGDLWGAVRRLPRWSTFALIPYFFVILPLGTVGPVAFLVRRIEVPDFISGELTKTTTGTIVWYGALLLLVALNLRLLLTLSVYLAERTTVGRAMARSWRLTRGQSWRLLLVIGLVNGLAGLLALGIGGAALRPTAWVEQTQPDAAPWVGGISLALTQVGVFVVTGFAAVTISHTLAASHAVLAGRAAFADSPYDRTADAAPVFDRARLLHRLETPSRGQHALRYGLVVLGVALLATLSVIQTQRLNRPTPTDAAVVAHRGLISDAVENSVPALEAAAELDVDYVEIDLLQTADEGIVVIHDDELGRLAGLDQRISQMTLEEATAVVQRQGGHEAPIPSFEEVVARSVELEQPLLVEIKTHGGESEGYVADVLEVLERHDVADVSLVQAIDRDIVEQVDALAPDVPLAYVVPIRFGYLPSTPADYVVVETSAYNDRFLEAARDADVEIMVWTVNDDATAKMLIRDGVDGVITDEPAMFAAELDAVREDDSILRRLDLEVQQVLWP